MKYLFLACLLITSACSAVKTGTDTTRVLVTGCPTVTATVIDVLKKKNFTVVYSHNETDLRLSVACEERRDGAKSVALVSIIVVNIVTGKTEDVMAGASSFKRFDKGNGRMLAMVQAAQNAAAKLKY